LSSFLKPIQLSYGVFVSDCAILNNFVRTLHGYVRSHFDDVRIVLRCEFKCIPPVQFTYYNYVKVIMLNRYSMKTARVKNTGTRLRISETFLHVGQRDKSLSLRRWEETDLVWELIYFPGERAMITFIALETWNFVKLFTEDCYVIYIKSI